jgi:phosphonate transport system permease protein
MTAGPLGSAARRPTKPPRSLALPAALVAFVAMTAWSASERFGIGFDVGAIFADITRGREILRDVFRPDFAFFPRTVEPMLETIRMAVIASTIGCGVALPIAFLASRVTAPNRIILAVDRGILNVLRALPDLLYAMVFVSAVSVGPLAGILALVLFDIAVTAKLLSETVDAVDTGPLEAARAAGAGHVQSVRTAIFPQVLPNYVAYSLYVFELNIRASAVIGIVGAGGIGNVLNAQMGFLDYEKVGLVILELFLLVFIIETISIALRRRLV